MSGDGRAGATAPTSEVAQRLRDLIPQMHEDAHCHWTWTTEAAQRDLADKQLADHVGDAAWHRRWAEFYERVAATMEEAAAALTRLGGAHE
jgi:hypothetical protein